MFYDLVRHWVRGGVGNRVPPPPLAVRWLGAAWWIVLCASLSGCFQAAPQSQFPSAQALLERARAERACSRGLTGEGKIDLLGDEGRIRADALYVMARPASIRFDVMSPLGGVLSTLTSDGRRFALDDRRNRVHLVGAANQCNLRQALSVPVPPEALTQLLSGQPPVLVHRRQQATLRWDAGEYLVQLDSKHDASQSLRFRVLADDYSLPWQRQRLELSSVEVRQLGLTLYRAELSAYRPAKTASPRIDPDGLEPDVPPSGPACSASLPGRLRFEVPGAGTDVLFEQKHAEHNPPLVAGVFRQQPSPGTVVRRSPCESN